MNLAGRSRLQDKTRLLLSVAGVGLGTCLDHAPGSVVLVQAGTRGAS